MWLTNLFEMNILQIYRRGEGLYIYPLLEIDEEKKYENGIKVVIGLLWEVNRMLSGN